MAIALELCSAGLAGYAAYEQANMTDAERMMLANLEALTQAEINPDCPNGCKEPSGTCWCYGEVDGTEAKW